MPRYLEFEVTLSVPGPKVWRRFLLTETATFEYLSECIQDAGPWGGWHMWEFRERGRKGRTIASIEPTEYLDAEGEIGLTPAASETAVRDHFRRASMKCWYIYDFGDRWEHEVRLCRTVELPAEFGRRLLAGERAFPPEDCGGWSGYLRCLSAVGALPKEETEKFDAGDLEEQREWLGDWTPQWSLEAARQAFDH